MRKLTLQDLNEAPMGSTIEYFAALVARKTAYGLWESPCGNKCYTAEQFMERMQGYGVYNYTLNLAKTKETVDEFKWRIREFATRYENENGWSEAIETILEELGIPANWKVGDQIPHIESIILSLPLGTALKSLGTDPYTFVRVAWGPTYLQCIDLEMFKKAANGYTIIYIPE